MSAQDGHDYFLRIDPSIAASALWPRQSQCHSNQVADISANQTEVDVVGSAFPQAPSTAPYGEALGRPDSAPSPVSGEISAPPTLFGSDCAVPIVQACTLDIWVADATF
ncbi:hypothetical protein BDW60DRAFT_210795 [Aspergillus nidulans var. acristatus]|jgi:hypothetical protein